MELQKYTLLIDQDDVLAEYIKGVTEAYNRKYNTSFHSTQCDSWDLYKLFGEEVETVMHDPELFRNLEPVKDALEVFERLFKDGRFELYIVTAANPSCVEAKYEWIKKYLPFLPDDHFIVCRKKQMIKGDILLDDGMHNIEAFKAAGGISIIFDRPHNKGQGKDVRRVKSWIEFEEMVMALCQQEDIENVL